MLAYRRVDDSESAHVMLNMSDATVDVELPVGVHALHSTIGPCVEVTTGRRRLAPYEGIISLSTDAGPRPAAAAGTRPLR